MTRRRVFGLFSQFLNLRTSAIIPPGLILLPHAVYLNSVNVFTWIILAAIVAFHLLDTIAAFLNLQALKNSAPADSDGIYDEETYRKLLPYTAANTRFGIIRSTFDLLVLLTFWLAGGFEALDRAVRALHWSPVPTGLVFIGVLGLAKMLLSLPFDVYRTFVIEKRFGFNNTTAAVFMADEFKGLLLAVILGAPFLATVLALFQYGGPHIWLGVWGIVAAFMLLMAYVAPAVIMPLFNKFEPLGEGALRDSILEYGSANRFPIAGIFVMDGSKRSAKSNAFFTGFGATKKIVLFDTLICNHTVGELVAVLAHEVGHFKHRHVILHMLLGILNIGLILFLASVFIRQPALHVAFFL